MPDRFSFLFQVALKIGASAAENVNFVHTLIISANLPSLSSRGRRGDRGISQVLSDLQQTETHSTTPSLRVRVSVLESESRTARSKVFGTNRSRMDDPV